MNHDRSKAYRRQGWDYKKLDKIPIDIGQMLKALQHYADYFSYTGIRLQLFVPYATLRMSLRRPVNVGQNCSPKTNKRSIRPGFRLRIADLEGCRIPEGFPN